MILGGNKMKMTIEYDNETRELFINGKSQGKMHVKVAASLVEEQFLNESRKEEFKKAVKKAL